jgi:hypothetical protein
MGFVLMGSRKFTKICQQAAWYISPSCSESCQAGALNGMATGLVPILSTAIDIQLQGHGKILNSCSLEEIKQTILEASAMSPSQIESESREILYLINHQYRPENFEKAWIHILNNVSK